MAEHFSFFDPVLQGDGTYDREYNAQQFTNYFKTLVTTGILKGERNELKLTATGTTMQTKIDTGVAYILGRYYENDSIKDLTHDTESLGVNRIDRVVIRLDLSTEARYVKSFIKKGAPSTNPVPPTLTQTQNVYEISLAQVRVVGGQTFIATNAVTDERGTNVICPWAGSNILPSFDDNALNQHISNQEIHVTQQKQNLWNNALQPSTYNASNTITNVGANRATRVFPQVNWKGVQSTPELWESILIMTKPVWGILELDIAGYSAASGGAKIVVELGISVPNDTTSPSVGFRNEMKVVSASQGFTDNFYIRVEHRPSTRYLIIQVFKRIYNDPVSVVATFTSTVSPQAAFDTLKGFSDGVNYTNGISIPETLQKDFDTRIKENFTLVSNGKVTVNQAVTDMGIYTAPDASFATTAANIRAINTGKKMASGTVISSGAKIHVTGLGFRPKLILAYAQSLREYVLYEDYGTGEVNYITKVSASNGDGSIGVKSTQAVITDSSFRLDVTIVNSTSFRWWAIE